MRKLLNKIKDFQPKAPHGSATDYPFSLNQTNNWKKLPVVLVLLALTFIVVSSNASKIIQNDGGISQWDEHSYIDYIFQASHGDIVRPGEFLSEEGMDYLACHEVIGLSEFGSGCGEKQLLEDQPLGGKQTADIHPPTYFLITAQIGKLIDPLLPQFDLIDSSCLVGSLWLLLGLATWLVVFRLIGVSLITAALLSALVALTPLVITVTSFISPDSTFALTSGIVMLATILWIRNKVPWWVLFIASAFPIFFKVTHLLSSILAIAIVIIFGYFQGNRSLRSTMWASASITAGTATSLITWQIARYFLRVDVSGQHADVGWSVLNFYLVLGRHFSKFLSDGMSSSATPTVTSQLFSSLILAAALGGAFYLRKGSEARLIAITSSVAVLLGAVTLSLITVVLSGGFLVATARYGLPLLLLWIIPLSLLVKEKKFQYVLLALTLISFVSTVVP